MRQGTWLSSSSSSSSSSSISLQMVWPVFFQTILLYLNYFWVCLHFVLSFTSARITTCTISSCTASEWSTEEVLPWIWTVLTRLRWVLMNNGAVLVLFCINIMIITDVLHPVWMNPIAKYTINSVCISYGESWILQWRILLRVITFNLMKVITIQIIWNSNVNEKKNLTLMGLSFKLATYHPIALVLW